MQLVGQTVKHVSFGTGVIVDQEERFLYVDFAQQGKKRFAYPDAFSRFLTFADADQQKEAHVLCQQKKQKQQAQRKREWAKRERLGQLHAIKVSPQSQAIFNLSEAEAAEQVKAGVLSTGCYLSGYAKGTPKVPNRMKPNTACLLTAVPVNGTEKDRQILGAAMVAEDFYGADCEDGTVRMHGIHRILLPEDQRMAYWDYFTHGDKIPHWGRASFKYFANTEMHRILRDMQKKLDGTDQEAEGKAFFHYFCFVNHLPEGASV